MRNIFEKDIFSIEFTRFQTYSILPFLKVPIYIITLGFSFKKKKKKRETEMRKDLYDFGCEVKSS